MQLPVVRVEVWEPMDSDTESKLRHLCACQSIRVPKILDVQTLSQLPTPVVLSAIPVVQLHAMGFGLVEFRTRLRVRALDLVVREQLTGELVNVFGRENVRGAFLMDAEDAILMTNTQVARTLHISPEMLLRACQTPAAAVKTTDAATAVLQQLLEAHRQEVALPRLVFKPVHPLALVAVDTLLRVGLGWEALTQLCPVSELKEVLGEDCALLGL